MREHPGNWTASQGEIGGLLAYSCAPDMYASATVNQGSHTTCNRCPIRTRCRQGTLPPAWSSLGALTSMSLEYNNLRVGRVLHGATHWPLQW